MSGRSIFSLLGWGSSPVRHTALVERLDVLNLGALNEALAVLDRREVAEEVLASVVGLDEAEALLVPAARDTGLAPPAPAVTTAVAAVAAVAAVTVAVAAVVPVTVAAVGAAAPAAPRAP